MKKNRNIESLLEKLDTGKKENVENTYPKPIQSKQRANQKIQQNASHHVKPDGFFPYDFCERRPNKKHIEAFHDILLKDHYDIAFEITWEALTPAALNPVTDPKEKPNFPENTNNEYQGYNKRWLTIDNRLAISPFTVKSAIANGFANILGGCYRVNNIKQGHNPNVSKGQYIYPGSYKRYRVAMDGSSKPGIVKSIQILENKDRKIEITPIEEDYLDKDLPYGMNDLKQGDVVYVGKIITRGYKPSIIDGLNKTMSAGSTELRYHGAFAYGKDSRPHRVHRHRFYKVKGDSVRGIIPAINFESRETLKSFVSIGGKSPEERPVEWYQDLSDIKEGSLVYFEMFQGRVTNIGKNFLFKALFLHEDAVPEESSECMDLTDKLCPRCRMFGMTDKTDKSLKSIGFKGRFKSSALINDKELTENITLDHIKINDNELRENIPLKTWCDKETMDVIASQELLPLSGPPKPNKRDIDGYFNKDQGIIKGAKYYLHGKLDSARNIWNVDADSEYTHRLRNYAQVCRKNLCFSGTVGAENCSVDEISAFLILLHSDYSHHGFKLGLGKAFGMGTFKSSINKVWIRKKDDYGSWQAVKNENSTQDQFLNELKKYISQIDSTYKKHKDIIEKTANMINNMEVMERRTLKYPQPRDYWKSAANMKK